MWGGGSWPAVLRYVSTSSQQVKRLEVSCFGFWAVSRQNREVSFKGSPLRSRLSHVMLRVGPKGAEPASRLRCNMCMYHIASKSFPTS